MLTACRFTSAIPWPMTRQWLQAVANSETVLLVSPEPGAVAHEQRAALREGFARCLQSSENEHTESAEPTDWLDSRTPSQWRSEKATSRYDWIMSEGEDPSPIGIQRGPD